MILIIRKLSELLLSISPRIINALRIKSTRKSKEIKNAPSALLSYISTRDFLRTREKCVEARAEGKCFSHLCKS